MESLNMKTLANSLPNSANAEKQLMDNFKAAALSITTLYRSSLDTSKQAYTAGYATCLQDILHFVEAGVSVSGTAGEEMTIGRVMDWIEARLEAIKSTEEEEEEDRLKDGASKVAHDEAPKEDHEKRVRKTVNAPVTAQSKLHRRNKESFHEISQPAPGTTSQHTPSPRAPAASSSPRLHSPSPPPPPPRPMRTRRGLKEAGPTGIPPNPDSILSPISAFQFFADNNLVSPLPSTAAIVGSKRRHAVMLADSPDSSNTPLPPSSTTTTPTASSTNSGTHSGWRRKRGRERRDRDRDRDRDREVYQGQVGTNSNTTQAEDMEVEEDGRERKRVARR